jgi:hypothetical protein
MSGVRIPPGRTNCAIDAKQRHSRDASRQAASLVATWTLVVPVPYRGSLDADSVDDPIRKSTSCISKLHRLCGEPYPIRCFLGLTVIIIIIIIRITMIIIIIGIH